MILIACTLLISFFFTTPLSALAQSPSSDQPAILEEPTTPSALSTTPTTEYPGFSISISPAFQEIEIGESDGAVQTVIQLTNHTEQPQDVELFALDFEQVGEDGQISLVNKPKDTNKFATYITFPKRRITLPAKESVSVPVSITNSLDFSPGGHYAAVVARFTKQDTPDLQQVLPGVSSLLLVHKLGGALRHLSIVESSLQQSFFTFRKPETLTLLFSNQGNVHALPRGKVTYSDLFGRTVFNGIINENSHYVLPQTRRRIETELKQIRPGVPIMLYTVKAVGSAEGSITFQQQYYVLYISPWFVASIVGLALIGSYSIHKRVWKKLLLRQQNPND